MRYRGRGTCGDGGGWSVSRMIQTRLTMFECPEENRDGAEVGAATAAVTGSGIISSRTRAR